MSAPSNVPCRFLQRFRLDGDWRPNCSQRTGSHRASNTHFALAADLCTGNRGIALVEESDGSGREQKLANPFGTGSLNKCTV